MNIKVYIERQNVEKSIKIDHGTQIKDILSHLKINPVTVIVAKNNEVVPEDTEVADGDFLQVISVISGG